MQETTESHREIFKQLNHTINRGCLETCDSQIRKICLWDPTVSINCLSDSQTISLSPLNQCHPFHCCHSYLSLTPLSHLNYCHSLFTASYSCFESSFSTKQQEDSLKTKVKVPVTCLLKPANRFHLRVKIKASVLLSSSIISLSLSLIIQPLKCSTPATLATVLCLRFKAVSTSVSCI